MAALDSPATGGGTLKAKGDAMNETVYIWNKGTREEEWLTEIQVPLT